MSSGVYNFLKSEVMVGYYNLDTGGDDIKAALMDNNHVFTPENDGWADVSANEITGTGYSSPGESLANQVVSIDDVDDEGVFDADDVQWTSATFTAYHCVLYDNTPTSPQADPLMCSIDFGGAQQVTSGTFTIQWATEGIIKIT
jgi:hypothetical protein